VVYDARILTEYREVLARPKFGFEESLVKAILIQIEEEGSWSPPRRTQKTEPAITASKAPAV